MEQSIGKWSLRLLKGDPCTAEEVPCKIEYKTQNGSACVFAAVQGDVSPEKVQFVETADGSWNCEVYTQQEIQTETYSQQQVYELFLKAAIDMQALKEDSLRLQRILMQEKEAEKQAQTRPKDENETTIW